MAGHMGSEPKPANNRSTSGVKLCELVDHVFSLFGSAQTQVNMGLELKHVGITGLHHQTSLAYARSN